MPEQVDTVSKTPFPQKIKRIFIAGILTCLPLVVTVYIILFLYRLLTSDLIPLVGNIALRFGYVLDTYILDVLAFAFVFLFIFLIGLIAKAYLGKKLLAFIDSIMGHIPIAKTIYKGTKQVIDSFSSTTGSSFSKVVLIEFPRRDMWMVGFVVKDSVGFMASACGYEEAYNVFVPTAPNPTSGFIAIVDKKDVREVDMSIEDGIKFVFSIGLVNIVPYSRQIKNLPVKK